MATVGAKGLKVDERMRCIKWPTRIHGRTKTLHVVSYSDGTEAGVDRRTRSTDAGGAHSPQVANARAPPARDAPF